MVTTMFGEPGAKDISKQLTEQINEYASNKPFVIQIHKMTGNDTGANTLTHVRFVEKSNIN